jgi:hypothetical protein
MHFLERLKMANSKLPMFIGGQTNGAKIATYVAGYKNTFLDLAGVVALGYPFYPQGQHKKMYQNTNHFASLKIPLLIVQGERDVFGEFPSVKANKSLIQGLP